uniref:Uncharacterized protein n=1 Tax=Magallana gigas TaxID=29159 RepID=K1R8Q4_MAGGI
MAIQLYVNDCVSSMEGHGTCFANSARKAQEVAIALKRMMINNKYQTHLMKNAFRDSGNLKRLLAQKRFSSDRQTRGGVALCLWKVCPAGPWLVQK